MQRSHQKKRNRLILIGFGMLLVLGIINLKSLPFSTKDVQTTSYPQPAKIDDPADIFIRKASQNFYYREFPEAAENYNKAIAIYESQKDFFHIATTYESLGDLHIMAREISEAEDNYVKASDFYSQAQNVEGQINSFKNIGDLHLKLEHIDIAEGWYRKALAVNKGLTPNITLGQTQEAMGHLYWKTNNISGAINSFKQAQNTFSSIKYNLGYEHLHHVIQKLTKISRKQPGTETPSPDKSPVY